MGFLDKLISIFTEEEPDSPLLPNNNDFSSNIDENRLENSLTLKLINLKPRLTLIEQTLPDRVEKLKREIDSLETELSSAVDETDIANVENKYLELEKQFNKLEPLCKEFLVQKELKILQKELDTLFFGNFNEDCELSSDAISKLEDGFRAIEAKKGIFSGEKLDLFLTNLMKADYRLKCCKMMYNRRDSYDYSQNFKNLLSDIHPSVYAIYGEFIKSDYDAALKTHSELVKKYSNENVNSNFRTGLNSCERFINELEPKLSKDFFADFIVDRVFKDNEFVRDFINLHYYLKDEQTHFSQRIKEYKDAQLLEVQKEEQAKIKAANQQKLEQENAEKAEKEKEFFKSATPEDLSKKLKDLDNSIFDIKKSYTSILEYELKVAEARGLLSPINQLQVEDMETRRISKDDIGVIIRKAQELGINYKILCDVDDNEVANCLLITVKGNANTLASTPCLSNGSYSNSRKLSGTYSPAFAKYFLDKTGNNGQLIFSTSNRAYYGNDTRASHDLAQSQLLDVYQEIQDLSKNPENIQKISVALEMSYLIPIVPILEVLNSEGIDYYIPPIDKKTEKRSATKKIYINRSDLETYKEKVQPKISSKELGNIVIRDENFDLANEILEGCDIPLIAEQAKMKEQQQRYKTLTEQEMRQTIKQIDDESCDITDSYKDILTFEKNVAREKGLLTPKNEMATDDIDFMRIRSDDLWRLMQVAKEKRVRCSFLLDVDEHATKTVLVAFSKAQKDKLQLPDIMRKYEPNNNDFKEFPGHYSNSFLELLKKNYTITNEIVFYNNSIYRNYHCSKENVQEVVDELYNKINKLSTTDKDIEDIKIPLQLSYSRPLVPILEKLKEAGIEYYIPPFDDSTNKYEQTKKIYIDRKDLALYKKKVHPQISKLESGVVSVGYENIKIPDIILDRYSFSFEQSR